MDMIFATRTMLPGPDVEDVTVVARTSIPEIGKMRMLTRLSLEEAKFRPLEDKVKDE
jgi:hypothetical protein